MRLIFQKLFFYLDNAIGTHGSAECASDAGFLIGDLSRMMTLLIDLIGCKSEKLLGTYVDTKSAALAVICVKGKLCHSFLPFWFSFYIKLFCSLSGKIFAILPSSSFATSSLTVVITTGSPVRRDTSSA